MRGPWFGPVVILVHGAVVNRATLMPLAQALPATYRIVVPDLPGHGSQRGEPFRFDVAVDRLTALVEAAGDAPVAIAGDSLGGYLALAVAARCGARLSGVVAGGCSFPMDGAAGLIARLTDAPLAIATTLLGSATVEGLIWRGFRALGGGRDVAVRTQALGLRLASRGESIAGLRSFDLAATLGAIRCPVTLVNGGRDAPIVWLTERYARCARNGRAVVVAGAFHGVMTFAPHAVAREIVALFDRPPPPVRD